MKQVDDWVTFTMKIRLAEWTTAGCNTLVLTEISYINGSTHSITTLYIASHLLRLANNLSDRNHCHTHVVLLNAERRRGELYTYGGDSKIWSRFEIAITLDERVSLLTMKHNALNRMLPAAGEYSYSVSAVKYHQWILAAKGLHDAGQ
jgi:hypothetical protein